MLIKSLKRYRWNCLNETRRNYSEKAEENSGMRRNTPERNFDLICIGSWSDAEFVGCLLSSITFAPSNSGKEVPHVFKCACSSSIYNSSAFHHCIMQLRAAVRPYLSFYFFSPHYPIMSLSDKPLLFVMELIRVSWNGQVYCVSVLIERCGTVLRCQ